MRLPRWPAACGTDTPDLPAVDVARDVRAPLNLFTWAVRVLLAAAFAAAAIATFSGMPMMVQTFEQVGVGQWFRYVTAAVEFAGAVMLPRPATALFAGLLLGATMLGAILAHLFVIGGSPVPALVLGVLSVFVNYRLRSASAAGAVPAAVQSLAP